MRETLVALDYQDFRVLLVGQALLAFPEWTVIQGQVVSAGCQDWTAAMELEAIPDITAHQDSMAYQDH